MNNYPAPWNLEGYGYILLYRFDTNFANKQAPDFLKKKAIPGFGSVMLVNYETSNCGPYGELLIIPGKYDHHNDKLHTISKIYVSSQDSVNNGRINWGIPKEHAHFNFETLPGRLEKVTITSSGSPDSKPIFEATFKSGRIPFPVNTSLLPFPLVQQYHNKEYRTTFKGKGTGRLATMVDLTINPEMFPGIDSIKPIAVIQVSPFNITFPVAHISKTD